MLPTPIGVGGAVASAGCGPIWILLAALLGVVGALFAQWLADKLTRNRELRRFRIESFERFRSELWEDADLKVIRRKHTKEPLTNEQIQDYVGFWEEVGIYQNKGIIDEELLDEILGDYIIDCYNDVEIRKVIAEIRTDEHDDSYYEYFEKLARILMARRRKQNAS
jgi:hypothetical protein